MKPARAWADELVQVPLRAGVEPMTGQSGEPTLRVDGVYLHSRYRPREDALKLVDSVDLPPDTPLVIVGIGCGYHVEALVKRGAPVIAFEPDHCVARCAIEGVLRDSDVPLHVGDMSSLLVDPQFTSFAGRNPVVFVHPPTERLHPRYVVEARNLVARARIAGQRLGIAIVGPMYGGSLPIAGYLASAFKQLGHRTLFVDNSEGWPLYQSVTASVQSKSASGQLGTLLANVLEQWSYARVAEFAPNICIVMAQAPVSPMFPHRLAKEDIVSAFWFVENWRHMPYWQHIAAHYDCFFHIQPGDFERKLEDIGCRNHAYVQTACDPEVHKPVTLSAGEQQEFGCDVAFAGAGYYNRNQFLQGLTDYRLKIWGTDWGARELLPHLCRPDERFTAELFTKIVAGAAVNLNLHSSAVHSGVDPRCDAINPRVFEIAACGGLQLCDPCQGLDSLFNFTEELPVYRDLPECRKLIDHFLANPTERRSIAARARERVLREHTYAHRAEQMLEFALAHYAARVSEKGVRAQRTVAEVAERVGRSTELGKYLAALPAELPFTQSALSERIPVLGRKLSYPEGIFSFLRELRSSAETLLAMFDGA